MPVLKRGFTLVELLLALALLGIVAAALWRALDATRQTYFLQAQRVELRHTLRAAAAILPAELRELDAADSDITSMAATSVRFRATRQLAFLCAAPQYQADGSVALTVRQHPLLGLRRSFSAGDSGLLYHEGDPTTRGDDHWLRGRVRAVSDDLCPDADHPRAAHRLSLELPWTADGPPDIRGVSRGAPLRGFESVAFLFYRSPADTQWYLGQQIQDETVQPLLGPLIGADGVAFAYYDSAGALATSPTAVSSVEIRLRGRTTLPVRPPGARRSGYETDSLVTRVALRNNRRLSAPP